jgi:gamma-glutamyltranspeptidase
MKKINFRFLGMLAVLLCVCSTQVVFADNILIRNDGNTGNQPNALIATKSYSLSSQSVIQVTADLSGSDLIVDFSTTVGTAYVSVVDKSGNVVYQTAVDTFSSSEVIIPVDNLSSGSYSVKISYGSTKLIGNFKL